MITRRLFVQLGVAALTAAKSLLWWSNERGSQARVAQNVTPRRSVCYLYNPGADITGIGYLTFNTVNSLPGGQVTRITDAEEWVNAWSSEIGTPRSQWGDGVAERLTKEGRLSERSESNWFGVVTARHWGIKYSAKEILIGLLSDTSIRRHGVVEITAWENKDVDLDGVNALLTGKTVNERRKALLALPIAWRMTSTLRPIAIQALSDFTKRYRAILTDRVSQTGWVDAWQRSHAQLLEIDLAKLRSSAIHIPFPSLEGREIKDRARVIRLYEEEVLQTMRNYIGPDPAWTIAQSELDRHLKGR